ELTFIGEGLQWLDRAIIILVEIVLHAPLGSDLSEHVDDDQTWVRNRGAPIGHCLDPASAQPRAFPGDVKPFWWGTAHLLYAALPAPPIIFQSEVQYVAQTDLD